MSNEIKLKTNLTYVKGKLGTSMASSVITSVSSSGKLYLDTVQSIATTDTVVSFTGLGAVGFYQLTNLDTANTISIGFDGTNYPIILNFGQTMIAFNNSAVIHAKASGSSTDLGVRAIEA